jgi:hypothetical protein
MATGSGPGSAEGGRVVCLQGIALTAEQQVRLLFPEWYFPCRQIVPTLHASILHTSRYPQVPYDVKMNPAVPGREIVT